MKTVHVNLGPRSYDIEIGSGNLPNAVRFCDAEPDDAHAVIITDENVDELYAEPVAAAAGRAGRRGRHAGRRAGRAEQVARRGRRAVGAACSTKGPIARRSSWPSAAAWSATWPASSPPPSPAGCASSRCPPRCWPRSIARVGGKVGINLPGAKNMVGAFWQPRGVLIDTAMLATLPDREYRAGLAEVVKYGVILDAEFFAYLEANVAPINAPRPGRADAHRRPLLPAEGRRRREGRARGDRPAGGAQLRPHLRPRLRGGHRLRARCCTARPWPSACCAPRRLAERLGRVDAAFAAPAAQAARSASACRSTSPTSTATSSST